MCLKSWIKESVLGKKHKTALDRTGGGQGRLKPDLHFWAKYKFNSFSPSAPQFYRYSVVPYLQNMKFLPFCITYMWTILLSTKHISVYEMRDENNKWNPCLKGRWKRISMDNPEILSNRNCQLFLACRKLGRRQAFLFSFQQLEKTVLINYTIQKGALLLKRGS